MAIFMNTIRIIIISAFFLQFKIQIQKQIIEIVIIILTFLYYLQKFNVFLT